MKRNEEVVMAIKELLEKAEAGEIQGLAAVTVEPRREVGQCVVNVSRHKADIIFGIEAMKRDVMDGVERMKEHYPDVFEDEIGG